MKRFCLALDLKNDPQLIKEYEDHHKKVWPEVVTSIKNSGINSMEIFRVENRLLMILTAEDGFSFAEKGKSDARNKRVMDWEKLMWKYQQPIPGSKDGEKWRLMERIFDLEELVH